MNHLRFDHVFFTLMLTAVVSAFILPPRFTTPVRIELTGIFSPVSRPVTGIAAMIHRHIAPDIPVDDASPAAPRPESTILDENRQLRMQLSSLEQRFEALSKLNADRQLVGNIQQLCKPVAVSGVDTSGVRESLIVGSSSLAGLRDDMPVLCAPQSLAGRIAHAGITGAQVRLITDPGFAVTGRILQYKPDADGQIRPVWIENLQPLVVGVGNGTMVIRGNVDITMQKVAELGIHENDVITLDDPDWPVDLRGTYIGRIDSIHPQPKAPLLAEMIIKPFTNLMRLREVMVMTAKSQ